MEAPHSPVAICRRCWTKTTSAEVHACKQGAKNLRVHISGVMENYMQELVPLGVDTDYFLACLELFVETKRKRNSPTLPRFDPETNTATLTLTPLPPPVVARSSKKRKEEGVRTEVEWTDV